MESENVDACVITSNVNLWYATDHLIMGCLYIPAQGEPLLFVRRPVGLSGDRIFYIRKVEQLVGILKEKGLALPRRVMLEGDILTHAEWLRYEALFAPATTVNGSPAIRQVRGVKTAAELEIIRRSGKIHADVYRKIPGLYRSGMTDLELSIEIEREMRLAGNLGILRIFGQSMEVFFGSVLTGDNAAAPSPYDFALGGRGTHPSLPIGADNSVLRQGTTVMIDVGGNFEGYLTDMTRIYSIGRLPERGYSAHQTALDIQNEIAVMAKPGVNCEDIYNLAIKMAERAGLADCFMGSRQQARFIGHGVGVELNELPVLGARSRDILATGMVLALEPKFVLEGIGAVGIENTFIVTDKGLEKATVLNNEADEGIIDLEQSVK